MNLKNILSSGDYVIPVPFGAHITLQYDDSGSLEKVLKGWEDNQTELSHDMIAFNIAHNLFPTSLVTGSFNGTTWISGVLYTSADIVSEYTDVTDALLEMFMQHPENFQFFGCATKSTGKVFNGAASIMAWFKANNMNCLSGFLYNSEYTDSGFTAFFKNQFDFKYPLLASYIMLNGSDIKYYECETQSEIVDLITSDAIYTGQIIATIFCKSGNTLSVDYSVINKFKLCHNTCILMDEHRNILYSYQIGTEDKFIPSELSCSICGRPIEIKDDEMTICGDEDCPSRIIPNIKHFVRRLNLEEINDGRWLSYISEGFIKTLADIFKVDEYMNTKIECSLGDLFDAIVPISAVRHRQVFTVFTNNCSNGFQVVNYYINNPNKIISELGIGDIPGVLDFANWLSTNNHNQVVSEIMNLNNYSFTVEDKKFDGAPIFRGKKIYITGKFNRGDTADIIKILKSYSADVTTQYDDSVTEVLVGDIPEDVSGTSIRKAKKSHIPINQESGFFQLYDIDTDLRENLG